MTQSDHKAAEGGKSGEDGSVFFMTGEESAVITKPGDCALDNPAFSVAAQWPPILRDGVGSAVGAVWRDHLDAEFSEGLIQRIAAVSLVPDEALGLNLLVGQPQGLLHHGRFAAPPQSRWKEPAELPWHQRSIATLFPCLFESNQQLPPPPLAAQRWHQQNILPKIPGPPESSY